MRIETLKSIGLSFYTTITLRRLNVYSVHAPEHYFKVLYEVTVDRM